MSNDLAIIGGKGMLGTDLAAVARDNGMAVKIYDLPEFDITNRNDLEKVVNSADWIVNCAAYTQVDRAESEPGICTAVNAVAVCELGKLVNRKNKYLVHISTDFVFGDTLKRPLREDDPPHPLGVYGRTKLEGERLLDDTGCRHAIMRVQWTYGKHGENFITKILSLAKKLDKLKVVDDQLGAPTHTVDMARAIMALLRKQAEGLYHFAAEGYATRYEVAAFIFKELKINIPLSPCSSDEFPAPAKRPKNSRFNCEKIDGVLDFVRPTWRDSLGSFLQTVDF